MPSCADIDRLLPDNVDNVAVQTAGDPRTGLAISGDSELGQSAARGTPDCPRALCRPQAGLKCH